MIFLFLQHKWHERKESTLHAQLRRGCQPLQRLSLKINQGGEEPSPLPICISLPLLSLLPSDSISGVNKHPQQCLPFTVIHENHRAEQTVGRHFRAGLQQDLTIRVLKQTKYPSQHAGTSLSCTIKLLQKFVQSSIKVSSVPSLFYIVLLVHRFPLLRRLIVDYTFLKPFVNHYLWYH